MSVIIERFHGVSVKFPEENKEIEIINVTANLFCSYSTVFN